MREEQAVAAKSVLQRQRLGFELDAVITGKVRAYVDFRRLLLIRVTELEHDFRLLRREPVLESNAPAKDEGVVVKPEILRVEEHHLANRRPRTDRGGRVEFHAALRRRFGDQLRVLLESLGRSEFVGLQDQLAFEVLDIVQRAPVGILARLEVAYTGRSRICHLDFLHLDSPAVCTASRLPKNIVASFCGPRARPISPNAKNGTKATKSISTRAPSS